MANKKFSEFTTETNTSNIDFLVGYDGTDNVKVDPQIMRVETTHHAYLHSANSSANYYFIPINSLTELTSGVYYHLVVAPLSGRLRKVILKNSSTGTAPTATSTKIRVYKNGTQVLETTAETHTAELGMSATFNFSDTDVTFAEGDGLNVAFNTNGFWQQTAATFLYEYE